MEVRRGVMSAVETVVSSLKSNSRTVTTPEEIAQVERGLLSVVVSIYESSVIFMNLSHPFTYT